MFQKLVTKYWLTIHLVVLLLSSWVGLFSGQNTMGVLSLWLAVFVLHMLMLAPTLKRGETLAEGRHRVLLQFSRDPVLYIGGALILFALAQWLNSGCKLVYHMSAKIWRYAAPPMSGLPYSVDTASAMRHLMLVIALVVLALCLRVGVGRSSRMMFLLIMSACSGFLALGTFALALTGNAFYQTCAITPSATSSGVFFSFWMFVGIGVFLDAIGNSREWPWLAYFASVLSNLVGVLYFASEYVLVIAGWGLLVVAIYSMFYVRSIGLRGLASLRFIFLFALGVSICIGVVGWVPAQQPLLTKVVQLPQFATRFEQLMETKTFRSKLVFKIWDEAPWTGVGPGGYSRYMGFFLRDQDWKNVQPDSPMVLNDALQFSCENGIIGSILLAAILIVLVSPLFYHIRMLWIQTAHAQALFLADLSPAVVSGVIGVLMCVGSSFFASPFQSSGLFLSVFSVLAVLPGTLVYAKKKAK